MTTAKQKNFILAGDIGGTKTNLGLFYMGKTRPIPTVMDTYINQEAAGLEDIISRFQHILYNLIYI